MPGAFRELQRQLLDDLPRDRVLHFEDICRRAIETLSPDLAFIRCVDEVHLHDEAVASLHHLAGQQEARAQLAAKRLRIQVGPFVAEDGASRHHAKSIDASQVIDEALGDSVTQVLGFSAARITERHDGDRVDGGVGRLRLERAAQRKRQVATRFEIGRRGPSSGTAV